MFTKKHFKTMADLINTLPPQADKDYLIQRIAEWFAQYNEGFNREKFIKACKGIHERRVNRESGDRTE